MGLGEVHNFMDITWDEKWTIGIEKIDEQHKELFERMNKLVIAIEEGRGKSEINSTLEFLEEYVIKHFSDEEEIQRKNNYSKYEIQHEQHEQFKEELKNLKIAFDETGESVLLAVNIRGKIAKWIKEHITTLDTELGEFLRDINK